VGESVSDAPTIVVALAAVMADVGGVAKRDRNQSQGFNFRGIDAVINEVGPVLRRHGVVPLPLVESTHYEVVTVGRNQTPMRQCTMRVRWRFVGPAGDHLDAVVMAEAMDAGDKATSKAHSVSYRTVLLQVLCIPTDETDADSMSYERVAEPEPLTASQQNTIATAVAGMDESSADELRTWWKAQRFPKAERLTGDQAAQVIAHLEQVQHA